MSPRTTATALATAGPAEDRATRSPGAPEAADATRGDRHLPAAAGSAALSLRPHPPGFSGESRRQWPGEFGPLSFSGRAG
jgi:hypothetical protein